MVLRRGADHARTTNVDLFDRFLDGNARLGDRLLEWVEIADHQLERRDVVLLDRGGVAGEVGTAENRPVDLWVQRLHATVHDLRKAGVARDVDDVDTGLLEVAGRSASGEDFEAERDQSLCEWSEVGLVADADEGAAGVGG